MLGFAKRATWSSLVAFVVTINVFTGAVVIAVVVTVFVIAVIVINVAFVVVIVFVIAVIVINVAFVVVSFVAAHFCAVAFNGFACLC
jgi:hypothetical protein